MKSLGLRVTKLHLEWLGFLYNGWGRRLQRKILGDFSRHEAYVMGPGPLHEKILRFMQ